METGADGEDCGGAEAERYLPPDTEIKTEDSSECETEDRDVWRDTGENEAGLNSPDSDGSVDSDFWTEHRVRRVRSGLNSSDTDGSLESDDCRETREVEGEHQSGLHFLGNIKHKRRKSGKKSKTCTECSKMFRKNHDLKVHMRTHTGERPYSCTECGKGFIQKQSLTRHLTVHSGKKPFSCSECNVRFNYKEGLTRHMLVHSGEKRYSCGVCDQTFTWHRQLKVHKCAKGQPSELHLNKTDKKIEAELGANGEDCGGADPEGDSDPKRYLHPETEDASEAETDDSDDWRETQGQRPGLNSAENIKDKRTDTDKKPHSCLECGKKFRLKFDLTLHIRIHTGERPYSCSKCEKRFIRKGSLSRHMMSHMEERPFICSECGKTFKTKINLTLHMQIHSEEKPYGCSRCGKRFYQKGSVAIHMITCGRKDLLKQYSDSSLGTS
ncbi:gastrula zinc finger protein XlCGF57.1-like isoform X2 [Cheilinus undulatus]|nr:gastrula zinc finger protein XlCGF57.1-like isoform X2 [Cheilinus undulatus]